MHCPSCQRSIPEHVGACACGHRVVLSTTQQPPKRIGVVNDYAGVLDADEKDRIETLFTQFRNESRVDLVAVMVETTGDLTPEEYAYWLFRKWKLRRLRRTGFLILIALKERRVETEIGFGFERVFSEQDAEALLEHILIPHFKKGWYGSGLVHAARELSKMLYQKTGMTYA